MSDCAGFQGKLGCYGWDWVSPERTSRFPAAWHLSVFSFKLDLKKWLFQKTDFLKNPIKLNHYSLERGNHHFFSES